ncbi:hypothetical protein [Roseateles sp. P5_E4]
MQKALTLLLLACLGIFASPANSAQTSNNQLELCQLSEKIYQAKLQEEQTKAAACKSYNKAQDSDERYAKRFFEQENEIRDVEISIFKWQIWAANVILFLVGFLTVAAVCFCGYQLWKSTRLSKLPANLIEVELSVSKLRLQTSLIGVMVLFVSYAFLLVFAREIYQVRMLERPALSDAKGATPSK